MNLLLTVVLPLAQEVPEPEDVKAGWLGFAVFILLIVAVVLLARSMVRHLRKADKNLGGDQTGGRQAGQNGDVPRPGM